MFLNYPIPNSLIAMNSFLTEFHLKSILLGDQPTFHHNNQTSESQIDHIYFFIPDSSKVSVDFLTQLCLKENSSNLSSHDVIVGSIKLPTIPSSKSDLDHSSSYTDFQVKKPKWCDSGMPGYQLQTTQVLQNMFDRFNLPEHIPLLSETCSKMLVLSAEHNF